MMQPKKVPMTPSFREPAFLPNPLPLNSAVQISNSERIEKEILECCQAQPQLNSTQLQLQL